MKAIDLFNVFVFVLIIVNFIWSFVEGDVTEGIGWACCSYWYFRYRAEGNWEKL